MSQQINLLDLSLRQRTELLSASSMARIALGFLLLLGAVYGYAFYQTRQLAAGRELWAGRAQAAQAALTQATQQYPIRKPSPIVQAELAATEDKIKARERVLAALNSGAIGNRQGFSAALEAFARQSRGGLWLTGLSLNGAGDRMRITGRALSPDLIPPYIQRLSAEPALRGRQFTAMQVSLPKPDAAAGPQPAAAPAPAYVEFVLSAEKADAAAKGGEAKP